ncbi:MAG: MATE family efflux transporter [Oscillospiraceae bacterium]|nr:MATE family efflux transporter [Oscillospiraceae bacterium]
MNRDLTVGKPSTVLWKFCLPLFGSIIFQQLYNIADSLVAGKFISEEALAAVGNGYEVTLLFIAVAFGCNIGCSVITAQKFGARQYGETKTAVYTTLIASGVVCLVLMVVGFVGLDGLLRLIQTPENVFADSRTYLEIYILSLPFVFYYNVATGVFSALGDSKTPFIFLVISSLSNIGADILFVTAFDMGVPGVAWATLICQGVSCVLAVWVVMVRLRKIPCDGKAAPFSWQLLKRIAVVAIPSMLQQSFISVGNMMIQSIINTFGSGVMAGYSGAIKLNNLVITAFTTLGNGVSNYTAQNLGAGEMKRIKEGFKAGLKLVWVLCVPLVLLYFLIGDKLMLLFVENPSGEAMSVGVQFLRIVSPFYFVVSIKLVTDGILRGAGQMKQFMVSTFTDLILRVVLAAVLSATILGATGIWLAWPVGWVVGTVLSLCFYRVAPWVKTKAE